MIMIDSKNDVIHIIKEHLNKYPCMKIQDACKLIYQSVFGGGHMISNPSYSLERIKTEYEAVKKNICEQENVVEPIGNHISRFSLKALNQGLLPETLNQMFVLSANRKKGSVEELEENLSVFLDGCKKGDFSFEHSEVYEFIDEWKKNGYPAISHTEQYRQNYHPAYRVIDEVYGRYLDVFLQIDRLLEQKKDCSNPLIIAIDGMAASGKSTLGDLLKEVYDCNLFHVDDYFLQPHQRTEERLKEPGGNVDYERFKTEIYDQIDQQKDFVYQKYDCSVQKLGEKVEVSYRKLNIIEGAYCMHPYFNDRADLTFFMELPDELQKERIGRRNGEWMLNRFLTEWIPMEHCYFDSFGIRNKSIVISNEKK